MVAMGAIVLTGCMKVKNEVITSTYDSSKTPVTSIEYVEGESSATTMTFNVYGAAAKAAGSTTFTVFLATDVESDVLGNGATFKIVDAADTAQVKFTKLAEGDVYRPRVRANYDPFIYSSWTDIPGKAALVGTGIVDLAFGAPLSVSTTPTDETIAVKWTHVPYAKQYVVEYKAASVSEWEVSQPQETNSYTIAGLTEFSDYDVRIKAINKDAQESDYKAVAVKTQKAFSFKKKEQVIEFFTSRAAAAAETDKFSLAADIDMEGATLPAVATFVASFDGQGHALKNLKITEPLFTENSGAISNLVLDASCTIAPASSFFAPVVMKNTEKGKLTKVVNKAAVSFESNDAVDAGAFMASIAVYNYGTVQDCENQGAVSYIVNATSGPWGIAGIVAVNGGKVNGCVNKGKVTSYADCCYEKKVIGEIDEKITGCTGGIVAYGLKGGTVDKATNDGEVDYLVRAMNKYNGSVGMNRNQIAGIVAAPDGDITNSVNNGTINVRIYNEAGKTNAKEYNFGAAGISGGDYFATGQNNTNISDCTNKGTINVDSQHAKSNNTVGGIVGWPCVESAKGTVMTKNCINDGDIHITGPLKMRAGGVQGGSGNMDGCVNNGNIIIGADVNTASVAGSLCGFHHYGTKIVNCSAFGSVKSEASLAGVGGLVGNIANAAHSTGTGCAVNCELSCPNTAGIGMVIGIFNGSGSDTAITFGLASDPIKVAGKVNGTALTASNYADYVHGSTKYSEAYHKFFTEFGE